MSKETAGDQVISWRGEVTALFIASSAGEPMLEYTEAHLVTGRGIEGDRYFYGIGTHNVNEDKLPGYEVTLIEQETIEALRRDHKLDMDAGLPRRNIVTQGIALNHLVHQTFRIGTVLIRGLALREPCIHLAELTSHKLMIGLIHRGGIGAQILTDGIIRVGDVIEIA